MTLILTHDEVQQYFDMRDDLEHYKQLVHDLEDEIAMLRQSQDKLNALQEEMSLTYQAPASIPITEYHLPDVSAVIDTYDAKETRENRQGKAWMI